MDTSLLEAERLDALHRYAILDTPAERSFVRDALPARRHDPADE